MGCWLADTSVDFSLDFEVGTGRGWCEGLTFLAMVVVVGGAWVGIGHPSLSL